MTWLDALLGKIRSGGNDLDLEGALNFTGGLRAVPNPAEGSIDVSVDGAVAGTPLVLADYAAFRAMTYAVEDGRLVRFLSPCSEFICSTTSGSGIADDNNTVLKRTVVGVNSNERLYNTARVLVAATVADIRNMVALIRGGVLQAQVIHLMGNASARDGGGGIFDVVASTGLTDDGVTTIVVGDFAAVMRPLATKAVALPPGASASLLANGNNDAISLPVNSVTTVTGPTADVTLRGMAASTSGATRTLFLVYNYKTTVANNYGSLGTGIKPFLLPTGANVDLTAPGSSSGAYNAVSVIYDPSAGTSGAWRVTGWISG